VYPILKRSDERHVTMAAYNNPAFVEDIARAVATKLQTDKRLEWYRVRVTNHESIHDHDAFAEVDSRGRTEI
jgi:GTP cyclohydrolase IB